MKLDLSCPIELRGYTLSYKNNTVQASVRLYNLTNRRIASFEAIAKWRGLSADLGVAMPFSADRLRAGGENGFKIDLSCSRLPDADNLEIVFTSVRFEDGGPDWHAGEGMMVHIEPLEPISSRDLGALRTIAGQDAVCFARQDEATWRCVCGRVNANDEASCVRCHRSHAIAIGHTPESVRLLGEAIHPTEIESEDDEIAELHAKYLRHRTKLMHRTVATAVAVLALTALLVMQYRPAGTASANAEVVSIYNSEASQQEE